MPPVTPPASASPRLGALTQAAAITLVIPPRLDGCELWSPPSSMRSLTLPRADAEGVALPHTGQEPPPVELVLDKYLGPTGIAPEGYEIEHMLAAHYSAKYPGIPIAINIIDGAEYPQGKRDVIEEAKSFTAAAAAQGVVLPYFAGLFTDGTTYCLVFKEPGQAITHN